MINSLTRRNAFFLVQVQYSSSFYLMHSPNRNPTFQVQSAMLVFILLHSLTRRNDSSGVSAVFVFIIFSSLNRWNASFDVHVQHSSSLYFICSPGGTPPYYGSLNAVFIYIVRILNSLTRRNASLQVQARLEHVGPIVQGAVVILD